MQGTLVLLLKILSQGFGCKEKSSTEKSSLLQCAHVHAHKI